MVFLHFVFGLVEIKDDIQDVSQFPCLLGHPVLLEDFISIGLFVTCQNFYTCKNLTMPWAMNMVKYKD